ncbi:hypothetical protein QWZ16_20215 [Vibrio ostreicida]|uniref:Uncharacterized protein n=1 Tax=Vibrio ostreicida TaxID=526588 RepID=A0ABT8C0N7_9VIBR|nr:hypothetical protein [Vibrio ostreicida]MDN3611920.1 hypothetical protein [Vibrio ostreicida]
MVVGIVMSVLVSLNVVETECKLEVCMKPLYTLICKRHYYWPSRQTNLMLNIMALVLKTV